MNDFEQIKEDLSKLGYECKKLIGKGGYSSVFLCHSQKYNQDFAIKRSIKHKLADSECKCLISLNNPYIIKLYDVFNDPVSQYLVMEYCPCGTISEKGHLEYEQFVCYAKHILEAVAFCHSKKVTHRDIKPDNIFLDQYDNIKLADFGMAKNFNYSEKSKEKCGSLMFVPPEFFTQDEINPYKADIWSLGITFYFMATGNYPFRSRNPNDLRKLITKGNLDFFKYKMNPNIILLISKMTEKNPEDRPYAQKLLELPIFSNVSKKPLPNIGYRTKFSMKDNNKNQFELSHKQNHQKEILSYRKIIINPKIEKINHHFQPYKTM